MPQIKEEALLAAGLVFLASISGCAESSGHAGAGSSAVTLTQGTLFNPSSTGSIQGRVVWQGAPPRIPLLTSPPDKLAGPVLRKRQVRSNPNAPDIDANSQGIRNAVAFLRDVDVRRSKPWDIPPLLIEQRDCQYHVLQAQADSRVGIARRGQEIELVSRDSTFYAAHATGAAYFSLTFIDPDRPRKRIVREKGVVELSSAAGYYWMRAYVLVDDHPYYVRTGGRGDFNLADVPEGNYELAGWLPNWHELRHERDPESSVVARLFFRPAAQKLMPIQIRAGKVTEVSITFASADFGEAQP
jgi:hypothetical protein